MIIQLQDTMCEYCETDALCALIPIGQDDEEVYCDAVCASCLEEMNNRSEHPTYADALQRIAERLKTRADWND